MMTTHDSGSGDGQSRQASRVEPGTLSRRGTSVRRDGGLCSVGLMRSMCPSCLLLGLVLMPFELGFRGLARLIAPWRPAVEARTEPDR